MDRLRKSGLKAAIIDGYLDEPSCLGVPPYISPHIRYLYGALLHGGIREEHLDYYLIDQLREDAEELISRLQEKDLVIIIAGTTVPGRYLRGRPASLREIARLGGELTSPVVALGGPIIHALKQKERERYQLDSRINLFTGEIAALTLYQLLQGEDPSSLIPTENLRKLIREWAILGAGITLKHPHFPYVVCELETFRGCLRAVNCSFCSERLKKITYHRLPEDIIEEVASLYQLGNRYFRLGCQTDLLAYGGRYEQDRLIPNPEYLQRLYRGINEVAPLLKVLHMDNINPSSITANPETAEKCLQIITTYNTPGDIAAFGLESADPVVLEKNNINSSPEQVRTAIRIMNRIGGIRTAGIPRLLPGLNFLHGLAGERAETMELNYQFLKEILDEGLLVRRINIRQVQEIGNYRSQPINKYQFQKYKDKINKEINLPMLRKVFPAGTILKDLFTEKKEGRITFGRQLGTYPILVGIPGDHPLGELMDVVIVDHGYRSVTALPYPFNINQAGLAELEALPGIGKKRAARIFMAQPLQNIEHLNHILDQSYDLSLIKNWIEF